MKKLTLGIITAALSFLIISLPLEAAETKEAPRALTTPDIEMSHVVTATAKVEAVDRDKRTITLQGPEQTVTVKVEDWVDLKKIKSGDTVDVIYYESASARIFKKQEEPRPSRMQKIQYGKGKDSGPKPEVTAARDIEITGTVLSIDTSNNIIVIEDPTGNLKAHKVKDPKDMEIFEEGDMIAVSPTHAVAVSVEKASGKSPRKD